MTVDPKHAAEWLTDSARQFAENAGGIPLGDSATSPPATAIDFEMLAEVRNMLSVRATELVREGVSVECPMWHGVAMARCESAAAALAHAVGDLANYLNDKDAEAALVAMGLREETR